MIMHMREAQESHAFPYHSTPTKWLLLLLLRMLEFESTVTSHPISVDHENERASKRGCTTLRCRTVE